MALFLISFFAGVLTVISPCVLPLLPVIVGGSLAGGTSARRAATVALSLGISVFVFTFLLKVSTLFIEVPPSVWNWISGGVLFAIGIFFLIPQLWDLVPGAAKANRDSTALMSQGFMRKTFWGDVVVGAALGPVFSTCSPTYFVVLASVLPVSLLAGVADIFAYVIGMCAFLLMITLAGQKLIGRLGFAANPKGWFRRIVGALFVLIGIMIVTGTSAAIEAPLYNVFDETKIEQHFLQGGTGNALSPEATSTMPSALTLAEKQMRYHLAPELVSPDGYLNTGGAPINLAQYRGKDVVLLDFWDYSCINCERTLPYLTSWYAKYKDEGLVVIGVHTPEFAFEHDPANVEAALKRFGIDYPVVLDNEYQTWNAYGNQYWPHEYVIDIDGFITHDHIGEGEYDETEKAIQAALAERADRLGTAAATSTSLTPDIPSSDVGQVASPETYFGSNRNQYFGNGTLGASGTKDFTLTSALPPINTFYLGGSWDIEPEYAESTGETVIQYHYASSDVYFVAGTKDGTPVTVDVYRDGKPVGQFAGDDVNPATSAMTVSGDRLYRIIHDPTPGEHTLELRIHGAGLRAYTFTFG
jgi:cytochrome c biogenesis protein CcdA/thiol-disulfide isomerase/thioredoxin